MTLTRYEAVRSYEARSNMKPSERRARILDILYNRGRVQAKDLAREFDVGVKAIYGDIDYLCKFYNIERIRARGGGYRLINTKLNYSMVLSKQEMDFLYRLGERCGLEGKEQIRLKVIMKKLSDQARMLRVEDK